MHLIQLMEHIAPIKIRRTMLRNIISPNELSQLRKLLDESRNVVITCHTSPDGDAIGSSLAMYEYLTRKGKNAKVVVPNYFPDFLKWMHDADKITLYDRQHALSKSYFQMADLVIALDYNALKRIDELAVPFRYCRCKTLMIDHHESPEKFCQFQLSRPEMSSTCELLYRLLVALGEEKISFIFVSVGFSPFLSSNSPNMSNLACSTIWFLSVISFASVAFCKILLSPDNIDIEIPC